MLRNLLISAILVSVLTACQADGQATLTEDDKGLATRVARTLTAIVPTDTDTPPPESSPTETALPAAATATPGRSGELLVVYVDDGNPWLTSEGRPPHQLSDTGDTIDVRISEDGSLVVFLRRETVEGDTPPVEIRTVSSDGTDERVLMRPEDFDGLYPLSGMLHNDLASIAFIPGSHDLLLNTRAIPEGPGLLKYDDLLRLDTDSGKLSAVFRPEEGGDFVPSPDGSQVAVIRPDSISLANLDGSDLRADVVTYEPVITYSEFRYYAQPVWAGDSSRLAVMIPSSDPLADAPTGTAWRITADGRATEAASYAGDFFFTQHGASSVISPDFARVIVPRRIDSGLQFHVAPLGAELSSYDAGDLNWISWNPAGSHFVYGKGAPTAIQLGSVDGPPAPLVDGTDLRWIDPESFLVLSGSRGAWTLRKGTLDGTISDLVSPVGDFIPYDFAAANGP